MSSICEFRKNSNEEEKQLYFELQQSSELPDASQETASTLAVLIVDDNPINQKILGHFLLNQHICQFANNGLEALNLIFPNSQYNKNAFDIIFMDIKMPVMDGLSATKIIRKIEKEHHLIPVPIIGISGASEEQDKILALQAGMDNYLVKPIQKEEFYRIIKSQAANTKLSYLGFRGPASSLSPTADEQETPIIKFTPFNDIS
ncbi:MAG: Sensor histidine kinase RcsC [Legionellaceae bacterium]